MLSFYLKIVRMLEDVRLKALDYHRRKRIVAEKASKGEFGLKGEKLFVISQNKCGYMRKAIIKILSIIF